MHLSLLHVHKLYSGVSDAAPVKYLSYLCCSTDSEGHTWLKDTFETTPIMPTYLLAFIVCDYLYVENMTTEGKSIPVSRLQTQLYLSVWCEGDEAVFINLIIVGIE